MKNSKNKRVIILAVILLGLLVLAYKVMYAPSSESVLDNATASARVEAALGEIEKINFDMSVIDSLKSLKSIEIPLISLPIGRKDPFSVASGSN